MTTKAKNNTQRPLNKPTAVRKSGQLMMLLAMVPEFQSDIAELRKKFGIPNHGYQLDHLIEMPKNQTAEELKKLERKMDEKLIQLGRFSHRPIGLTENPLIPDSFQEWIIKIGEKFRLPYNLYNDCMWGVSQYALQDRILVPPRDWDIQNDPRQQDRPLKIRWAAIRAYTPLDKKEAAAAIVALNTALQKNMTDAIVTPRRLHDTDEQRLQEMADMLEQDRLKANGRKRYAAGSYMDTVSKQAHSEKKMRDLERKNRHDLIRVAPMAANERKVRKKYNDLAFKFFGFGLLPPLH